MLANRLKVLLAERNLQIKQLVADTSISRNTLSNLINKPRGNVSIKTVNELCIYLNISPADFFEFLPFDFSYKIDIVKPAFFMKNDDYFINKLNLKFYLYIFVIGAEGKKEKFEYRGINTNSFSPYPRLKLDNFLSVKLSPSEDKSIKKFWKSKVPPILEYQAWEELKSFLANSLNARFESEFHDYFFSNSTPGYRMMNSKDIFLRSDFMSDLPI